MRPDPRVCREPWPFNHLTLAEVAEYEDNISRRHSLPPDEQRRMADLGSRRVRAVVEATRT